MRVAAAPLRPSPRATTPRPVSQEPNWRPRFRGYHPLTAFAGLSLCLFIMFASEFNRFCAIPLGVIVLICVLYKYIEHRKVAAQWGDSMRGLRYQRARNALLELEKLGEMRHTEP